MKKNFLEKYKKEMNKESKASNLIVTLFRQVEFTSTLTVQSYFTVVYYGDLDQLNVIGSS